MHLIRYYVFGLYYEGMHRDVEGCKQVSNLIRFNQRRCIFCCHVSPKMTTASGRDMLRYWWVRVKQEIPYRLSRLYFTHFLIKEYSYLSLPQYSTTSHPTSMMRSLLTFYERESTSSPRTFSPSGTSPDTICM